MKAKISILIQELIKPKELYLWSGRGDHHIGHEVIPFIHAPHKMQEVSAQPALAENRKQKFLQSKLFVE